MNQGYFVPEHINAFSTMVSQLISVGITITDDDKCISLLCYFPYSWDSLAIVLGCSATNLNFDDVVESFLLEEMR